MNARIVPLAAALVAVFHGASLADGPRPAGEGPTSVVVRVSPGGFRWGDAAIGAAAASGVALALHGTSLFRRQLRKEER